MALVSGWVLVSELVSELGWVSVLVFGVVVVRGVDRRQPAGQGGALMDGSLAEQMRTGRWVEAA